MDSVEQGLLLHRAHVGLLQSADIKADHIAGMLGEQSAEIVLGVPIHREYP